MSSENKKFELDRRFLLKNILVGTGLSASGAFNTFLTSMMVGIMEKANAQAAGVDPAFEEIKFISLVMSGGLPRYYWDLPLRPNDGDAFVANPMLATKFAKNGSAHTSSYATTKINGINMPWIWDSQLPTTGGSIPMKKLADHMLIMRGIDLQIDSHEIDRMRQLAPVPGGLSLSGLVADAANTPIPAVGRNGGNGYYLGEKGIAYLEMGGTNPLSLAMSPFSPDSNMLTLNKGQVEKAIDDALLRMQSISSDKNKFLPSAFSSRFNAKKLMVKQFGNLQTEFTNLSAKYEGLISRSFFPTAGMKLAGVEDISIAGNKSDRQRIFEAEYFSGEDLQTLAAANTSIDQLAAGMAIAEFMIINGLSSSVNIQAGNFLRVFIQEAWNRTLGKISRTNSSVTYSTDVHFTGTDAGVILFTKYYRAVSACIFELTSRLKETKVASGGNLFDKTVISVTSEFNRLPRVDGSGADHGWQGSNYTVFAGSVKELTVLGNIQSDDGGKRGSWGLAGLVSELGNREAIIGNAASTMAQLLEVKTPTPNDQPFVFKESGKIKKNVSSLKNLKVA